MRYFVFKSITMASTEVFLEGQHGVIAKHIKNAKSVILVAVAYFTDSSLFDLLLKKAEEGVRVQLIVRDDEINVMSGINYEALKNFNGDFCFNKIIHNKFCVIDAKTVLSGSYNWTYQARRNHEDLTVINDELLTATMFMIKFFKIKDPKHFIRSALEQDSGKPEREERTSEKAKEIREKIKQKMIQNKATREQNLNNTVPPSNSSI